MRPPYAPFALALSLAACGSAGAPADPPFDAPPDDAAATPDAPASSDVAPDAPADRPAPTSDVALPMDPCPAICMRLVGAPGCMRDMPTCVRDCGTQIAVTSSSCRPALDAYFACGLSSPRASCSGMLVHFDGCDDQQAALVACAAGPSPDGGAADPCAREIDCASCASNASCGWCNGHCLAGDASGPTRPATCGGQPWVRSAGMCS